jgi:transcriptional regulator with XRE-family HTH domain
MAKKLRPTYATIVGSFLRLERKAREVPLESLAKKLGYSRSGWSRIETGTTPMTVNQLKAACDALSLAPQDVVAEVDTFWKRNYGP